MANAPQTRIAGLLAAVACGAALLRAYHAPTVFRGEDVVFIQRDPYYYRFQVEQLTARAGSVLDLGAFVDPGRDDLTIAALGWLAELFGGSPRAVGVVLAIYPVAVAVTTCAVAYLAASRLAGDRYAGLAAAATLAFTPAHVYRTALGFADHHAFDYLWLAVTFLALVSLVATESRSTRRQWATAVALGLALSAQTLAWIGSPLLVFPVVVSSVLVLFSTVRAGEPSPAAGGALVGALAVATAVTAVAVEFLSWGSRRSVAFLAASTLVLAALSGVAEAGSRRGWSTRRTWLVFVLAGALASVAAWLGSPALGALLDSGLGYFASTTGTVTEAMSLFLAGDPVFTVFSFLGLFVVLFVPALAWVTWRAASSHRPAWLAMAAYAWYFLALAAEQRRFAGEFSLFFAVVAGIGGLSIARAVVSARSHGGGTVEPGRSPLRSIDHGTLFLLAVGATVLVATSVAVVPPTMDDRVVTDAEYETAKRIEALGTNGSDSYVFSSEVPNAMYNYFADGRQPRPNYARRNFPDFALSSDAAGWYYRLQKAGTGAIVLSEDTSVRDDDALHTKLLVNLGSARGNVSGVGRYRLLSCIAGCSTTLFRLVQGALIGGTAPANRSVEVRTRVSVPGTTFTYVRRVTVTPTGHFALVVPYAGNYTVRTPSGHVYLDVPDPAVPDGRTVGKRRANASWSFEGTTGNGRLVIDERGGNHGVVRGADIGDGVRGSGLRLDGDGAVVIRDSDPFDEPDGLTLTAWFRTDDGTDYVEDVPFPRLVAKAESGRYAGTDGYLLGLSRGRLFAALGDGRQVGRLRGPRVDDGRWHRATLTWNGTRCRLFLDGRLRDSATCSGVPDVDHPLVVGATTDRRRHFRGAIDEVCLLDRAAMPGDCGPPIADGSS